ncbi:MAG: transglutaminase domain-containing protein [Phycisphaerales bacterium]|nr:MAG: transglutaminase domain-containing protein [Phycisphaerales bacterium]
MWTARFLVLNSLRWPLRVPIKWAIFALTFLAVCFPYPGRLWRHIEHWSAPNALIEPEADALRPLVDDLRRILAPDLSPKKTLSEVQRFVQDRITYAWDWNTWGMADYLPTVTETIEKGAEDCDGRAVVAASLLRELGFEVEIVTDFAHVWVKTNHGETMGPGEAKAVVATDAGLKIQPGALARLPKALAYGIGPFPLVRELIIVGVLWLLMLRSGGGVRCSLAGLMFMVSGLLFLKAGGRSYWHPQVWLQIGGTVSLLSGVTAMLVWARYNVLRCERSASAEIRDDLPVKDDDM